MQAMVPLLHDLQLYPSIHERSPVKPADSQVERAWKHRALNEEGAQDVREQGSIDSMGRERHVANTPSGA